MSQLTASLFWLGEISLYEQACMLSFLRQGFGVDVYSYQPLLLPEGIVWRDARSILETQYCPVYTHDGRENCTIALSDLFRYQLLLQGGLWVDADVFCLRPAQDYMALQHQARQRLIVAREDSTMLNTAVMMTAASHPLLGCLRDRAFNHEPVLKQWGELGPLLLTDLAREYPQQLEILPPESFYPIHYLQATAFLMPALKEQCQQQCLDSYALHLWNSLLTTYCIPKNILPPIGSYLHGLFLDVFPWDSPALPEDTLLRLLQGTQALKTLKQIGFSDAHRGYTGVVAP
jgi:hypothetical protein